MLHDLGNICIFDKTISDPSVAPNAQRVSGRDIQQGMSMNNAHCGIHRIKDMMTSDPITANGKVMRVPTQGFPFLDTFCGPIDGEPRYG